MLIFSVLHQKKYAAIAIISSVVMAFIYPYAQTLGNNIDLWFEVIDPLNFMLYIIFSALFGPLVALQIHNLRQPKICKISAGSGAFSSIISFSAIQCPGCVSLASLFLPISATTFLATYNSILTSISIALLLVGMYMLGGFKLGKK